jgi:hypothetical protein
VPIDPSSHVPLPHNVAGPLRGNPSFVHSGIPFGEDLKYIASRYLRSSGSHVDKLRVRRSRSGVVKLLIFLDISIASGPLQLEYHTPVIPVRVLTIIFSSHVHSVPFTMPITAGSSK